VSAHYDTALALVLSDRIEGGYSNNPRDPGGPTNRGMSLRAVRDLDAEGRLDEFLREQFDINKDGQIDSDDVPGWTMEAARAFYKRFYWDAASCDLIPWPLGLLVFDSAVNEGVRTAIIHLQRAVRVDEDGIMGTNTRLAAERYSRTTPDLLLRQFQICRLDRYRQLKDAETFFRGWAGRVLDLYVEALKEVA
jgi:lysozyme family protein